MSMGHQKGQGGSGGRSVSFRGRRAWVEPLGQLCEFEHTSKPFKPQFALLQNRHSGVIPPQGCCKGWLRDHSNTSRYLAQSVLQGVLVTGGVAWRT